MQNCWIALLLAAPLIASDQHTQTVPKTLPQPAAALEYGTVVPPKVNCAGGSDAVPPACSHTDVKAARREFRKATKKQSHSQFAEALEHFESAAKLAPNNREYGLALAAARQNLVNDNIHIGNRAAADGQKLEALGRFQTALELDPHNEFARQQLQGSLPPIALPMDTTSNQDLLAESIEIKPRVPPQTFHISGTAQDVITQVCAAYGITASIDESVAKRTVRLDLDRATWPVAMTVLRRLTRTFWVPFSSRQALFAADTEGNRKKLERSILRTFYFSEWITPQNLGDIVTALRAMFELGSVTTDLNVNSMSVRATPETLAAVDRLLQGLREAPSQVLLDVAVYQVSGSFIRSFGVTAPTEFQFFYLPTESAAASIVQSLAQQSSTAINNLGIGTRNIGLTLPSASLGVSQDRSSIQTLDRVTLRASQGEPAVLKIGEKYPILTSSYSSVTNSLSFQPPPPSFTFIDIGFNLKATPNIHPDGTIGVKLELQLSALGTQPPNGLPEILNSEFDGFITAKDGEPIVAAGNMMRSVSNTRSGVEGLASIPGIRDASSNASKQVNDDELLIVITPHIMSLNSGNAITDTFALRSNH